MTRDVAHHDFAALHAELNRSTRACWDRYAAHRERVMRLVPRGRAIAVLGAGNCNDLDLTELAQRFDALHLVDVDTEACDAALARDGVRAEVHEADLSGVLSSLAKWKDAPPDAATMRRVPAEASAAVAQRVPGPFDVVLSSAVVSQLVWSCMECFGVEHPALRAVALTTMMAHLQIALDLTRPGGTLVLAVDTLARKPEIFAELEEKMSTSEMLVMFEQTQQCLPATECSVLSSALGHLAPSAEVALVPPWLWTVADHRTSLVYAYVVTRAPA